jgi:hypothetical protein
VSHESQLVVETTLAGEIVGAPLDVSMATQPEGIHFIPESGEMWISSEPNEILIFMALDEGASTSTSPTEAPSPSAPTNGGVTNPSTASPSTVDPSSTASFRANSLFVNSFLAALWFFSY